MRRYGVGCHRACSGRMQRAECCVRGSTNIRSGCQHRHGQAAGSRDGARAAGAYCAHPGFRRSSAPFRGSSSNACSTRAVRSRPAIRFNRIDPRPFEVEVQSNEAALAKAKAVLEQASLQARRVALLTSQRVTSDAEHEKTIGALRQAEAEVEGRNADVARARLNLDYATIRAPIDGIIGAALVSEGALIVQNETNLATIQQLDPIYADFTQSVSELNHLRRAFDNGDLDRIAPDAAKVRLVLDDARSTRTTANCCFRKPRSTPIPARSRCVGNSRIRSASCCRACMSAS